MNRTKDLQGTEPGAEEYRPVSRRPIADAFRRTAQGAVRFCLRHDVHPDIWWGNGEIRWGRLTVLDWPCLAVILGCVQTIWVRLSRIMRALREKRSGQAEN